MLQFTDRAREMVLAFLEQGGGEFEALRIDADASEASPLAPRWELTLVSAGEAAPDDVPVDGGGFKVLVSSGTAQRLEGATVDYVERPDETGFEIRTAPGNGAAPPHEAPTGELADRVQKLLDEQVNPAVASHGGFIRLVDVKGTEVYMEMGGGCQGCAMSRMTLRQGVERMIRQSIPEVTEVHDVTDHDAGENPYFTG